MFQCGASCATHPYRWHNTEEEARTCSLTNLHLRDHGLSPDETAAFLHPSEFPQDVVKAANEAARIAYGKAA